MAKKSIFRDMMRSLMENDTDASDEDVDEITTTGNIAGYDTPRAFSKNDRTHKKNIEKNLKGTGYELIESTMPNKIIDVGLRNIKKQLHEINKILDWYDSVKTENDLNRDTYWKRTTRNIEIIEQQMIEVFRKIKKL